MTHQDHGQRDLANRLVDGVKKFPFTRKLVNGIQDRAAASLAIRVAQILPPPATSPTAPIPTLPARWTIEPAVWLQPNLVEPRVRLAVDDLCRPGDVVFDVGANFGYVSVMMSRRVGPRGVVCAFEANPTITQMAQDRLVKSGCANTQIYNRAIYSASNDAITLYLSDNQVADSVVHKTDRSIEVETLALDDFVRDTGLAPRVVKMDIEGAELDALLGFERTIAEHRPIMILEQSPRDKRCLTFMAGYGYLAIDLGSYQPIDPEVGLDSNVLVTDVLFITPEQLATTPYGQLARAPIFSLGADAFKAQGLGFTTEPRQMGPGRYLGDVTFTAQNQNDMACGVKVNGQVVMHYVGTVWSLTRFADVWNFELAKESTVEFFFRFLETVDPTFQIEALRFDQILPFDGRPPPCR